MNICNGGGFLHSYMTYMNVYMGRCVPQLLALKACATVYAQPRLHASIGEGKPEFVFGVRTEACASSCKIPVFPYLTLVVVFLIHSSLICWFIGLKTSDSFLISFAHLFSLDVYSLKLL